MSTKLMRFHVSVLHRQTSNVKKIEKETLKITIKFEKQKLIEKRRKKVKNSILLVINFLILN